MDTHAWEHVVLCARAHGSCAGLHEAVAPVEILQFSSLFRLMFRLEIPLNLG